MHGKEAGKQAEDVVLKGRLERRNNDQEGGQGEDKYGKPADYL